MNNEIPTNDRPINMLCPNEARSVESGGWVQRRSAREERESLKRAALDGVLVVGVIAILCAIVYYV